MSPGAWSAAPRDMRACVAKVNHSLRFWRRLKCNHPHTVRAAEKDLEAAQQDFIDTKNKKPKLGQMNLTFDKPPQGNMNTYDYAGKVLAAIPNERARYHPHTFTLG